MSEFDLIQRFFTPHRRSTAGVRLGVGDDAAVVTLPSGLDWVSCIDTMVAGVHFPLDASAKSIGHKALAVNLSDLAAMGAKPMWALLAITMPQADDAWVAGFMQGFNELAAAFDVTLIGGDTTRGPLTISVCANGVIPPGQALSRGGAQVGDAIYVSGFLGDAGAGLVLALREREATDPAHSEYLLGRLHMPSPRIALGERLRGVATAAIDISDGLLADLGHVLAQSGVGATIQGADLPISPAARALGGEESARRWALSAGDDYELCFTVPPERAEALVAIAKHTGVACHRIGAIESELGLRVFNGAARYPIETLKSHDHFR